MTSPHAHAQVKAYVESTGNAHPFDGSLCCRAADGAVEMRATLAASAYTSAGSVDGTTNTITCMSEMNVFKTHFPFIRNYTIEMVLAGQSGSLQLQAGSKAPYLLWGAERKPSFFDAQLLTPEQLTCYNLQSGVDGMRHSGDIIADNHFMHSVRCDDFAENVYCAAAVAFNSGGWRNAVKAQRRPLQLTDFEAVSPFILLVDHAREVMLAIPFSLEHASIGDSMMIAPLVFHLDRQGLLRWYVPATCLVDDRVDTGEYTEAFRQKMRQLARDFEANFVVHHAAMSVDPMKKEEVALSTEAFTTPTVSALCSHRAVFVQDGISTIDTEADKDKCCYIHFGTTLDIAEQFTPKAAPSMVLPILSGEAHGHTALALGRRASSVFPFRSSEEWRAAVDGCASVIVHADDGAAWYEGVMQAQLHRVVGLMIVHTSKSLPSDEDARSKEMTAMKLCCTRLMAGVSIILVQTPDGAAFFYRGAVDVLPIRPLTPSFAQAVDLSSTLELHQRRAAPLSIGSFVSRSCRQVLNGDGTFLDADAPAAFTDLVMTGGSAWENALAQLCVCLSTAQADAFKSVLVSIVLGLEEQELRGAHAHTQVLVQAVKDAYAAVPPDVDAALFTHAARQAVGAHKQVIRDAQRIYRAALGRVEQICSFRIVSARKVGVQQAQRKMAVAKNVGHATKLSTADLAKELMDTSWGFAVAKVNPDAAMQVLQAMASADMDEYLQKIAAGPTQAASIDMNLALANNSIGFEVADNCTMLDVEVAQIMLEHTQRDEHVLTATKGKQLTFCMQGQTHLVLPLYNDARLLNGQYVDFMSRTNDEHVADYRVSLRGLLSNLKARYAIKPSSPDLTFGIQMIVLSLMHSMARSISDPTAVDPESTVCETLRGLMYLWGTFAASGQTPVTFAFQLTQPGANIAQPKLRGEWTIYAMIAHIYPYLRLPLNAFKSNVRTLLVHALFRRLVAPHLTTTKLKNKAVEQRKRQQHIEYRNIALRWNYAACAVLTRMQFDSLSKEDAVLAARKLLDVKPLLAPTYTTKQLSTTLTLLVQGQPVRWDLVRMFVACATIKRSGCFAKHKQKATLAALVCAKAIMCDKINVKLPRDIVTFAARSHAPAGLRFCGRMRTREGKEVFVFKDPTKASDLRVQNEDAYAAIDVKKMRADAELARDAWRVAGAKIGDGMSNADFLRTMLPTIAANVSSASAKTLIIASQTPEPLPTHCVDNPSLAKLWASADVLHPSALDTVMPNACMRTLFDAIGVSAHDQARAIGDVLHILLKDLAKTDAAKTAAVEYLKNRFDCAKDMAQVALQAPSVPPGT